jgi:hypothetical protein
MSQGNIKSQLKAKQRNAKKCGKMMYFPPAEQFLRLPMPQRMTIWVDPQTGKVSIGQGVCVELKYANENFSYIFCHIFGIEILGTTEIIILGNPLTGACKDGVMFAVRQGEEYIDAYNFINM